MDSQAVVRFLMGSVGSISANLAEGPNGQPGNALLRILRERRGNREGGFYSNLI